MSPDLVARGNCELACQVARGAEQASRLFYGAFFQVGRVARWDESPGPSRSLVPTPHQQPALAPPPQKTSTCSAYDLLRDLLAEPAEALMTRLLVRLAAPTGFSGVGSVCIHARKRKEDGCTTNLSADAV